MRRCLTSRQNTIVVINLVERVINLFEKVINLFVKSDLTDLHTVCFVQVAPQRVHDVDVVHFVALQKKIRNKNTFYFLCEHS